MTATGSSIPRAPAPVAAPAPAPLARVLAVARTLSASDNLAQILGVIIDAMRDLLGAERASVFEYDATRDELYSTVAHGFHDPTGGIDAAGEIRIPASAGIAGEAARSRRVINVPEAYADPRFNQSVDRKTGFRTRSILTIPLEAFGGELIGVAQVLNKSLERGGAFTPEDEEIALALASQAAVAIRRAHLIEDRVVREKLERDLELARKVQQQSFPAVVPALPGYELAGASRPAEQTGGDAYDFLGFCYSPAVGARPVIAGGADVTLTHALLFIADATGHGVGPALSVTQARSMLRMGIRVGAPLADIAAQMNRQLCEDLPAGRFVTAWLAALDSVSHTLTSFSAGQAPLLHYRAATATVESRDADTMPFGITPDLDGAPITVHLRPGDIFAAISDGFFEAMADRGQPSPEQFGEPRVSEILCANAHRPVADILQALRDAVAVFTDNADPADDQTALIIKRII